MRIFEDGIHCIECNGYILFETQVLNESLCPYFCFKFVSNQFVRYPFEVHYYYKDKFDFEGKILCEDEDFFIVKNKTLIDLATYVQDNPSDETLLLKMKYL